MQIDFSNISEFKTMPKGQYPVRVTELVLVKASTGNKMIKWTLKVTDGEFKGRNLWTNTVLTEESLWVLRNYLTALGVEVPKASVNIEFSKIIGKVAIADVTVGEYNGKPKNYINDLISANGTIQDRNEGDELLKEVLRADEKPKVETAPSEEVETPEEEILESSSASETAPVEEPAKPVVEEKKSTEKVEGKTDDKDLLSFLKS